MSIQTTANTLFRSMTYADIDSIIARLEEQNYNNSREVLETYFSEQENGERIIIVAEFDGEVAGYVTLLPQVKDAVPFLERKIPEIKDFNVLEKFRRRGIGTMLMDEIEAAAAKIADTVCLGVGLHSGYGAAQRMYAKRGYIPDGSGIWEGDKPAEPYGTVMNDDDLILYMSKSVRTP